MKKYFSGDVNYEANFPFLFLLQKQRPLIHTHTHTYTHTLIGRGHISLHIGVAHHAVLLHISSLLHFPRLGHAVYQRLLLHPAGLGFRNWGLRFRGHAVYHGLVIHTDVLID